MADSKLSGQVAQTQGSPAPLAATVDSRTCRCGLAQLDKMVLNCQIFKNVPWRALIAKWLMTRALRGEAANPSRALAQGWLPAEWTALEGQVSKRALLCQNRAKCPKRKGTPEEAAWSCQPRGKAAASRSPHGHSEVLRPALTRALALLFLPGSHRASPLPWGLSAHLTSSEVK